METLKHTKMQHWLCGLLRIFKELYDALHVPQSQLRCFFIVSAYGMPWWGWVKTYHTQKVPMTHFSLDVIVNYNYNGGYIAMTWGVWLSAWLLNNCSCLHVSISTCPIPPLFARIRSWCTTSLAPRSLFEFGSQTLRFNLRICCWYSPIFFWVQRRAHDSAWVPLDLAIWEASPTKSSSCQQA